MAKIQIFLIAFWLGMRVEGFIGLYKETFTITVGFWDIALAILTTALLVYFGALLSKAFKNHY